MCVDSHINLRVVFVVVTTFYTLVNMRSIYFFRVALVIVICPPLADQGWCSAQRIRILMIASGNHTIIHAVMAVSRKAMTEGIRTPSTPGTLDRCSFTIPQSKIRDFCQLPLHKGAVGAPAPVRFSAIGILRSRSVTPAFPWGWCSAQP